MTLAINWYMTARKLNRVVPDTSAVINRIITKGLEDKKYSIGEIIIHKALVSELENQANQKKETGLIGLTELSKFKDLVNKKKLKLTFAGELPTPDEIKLAKRGSIDGMIRRLAETNGATLITSDFIQAQVAEAVGVSTIHIPFTVEEKELIFLKYFKPNFMSVHLKEGEPAKAKIGEPGNWEFKEISKNKLTSEDLESIADQILEASRTLKDSFLEIERKGSIIAQIKDFRIVITKQPLSEAWEITIVRPVKTLELSYYKLSQALRERILSRAEGILIAGAPGHGKSTFAQSLVKEYSKRNEVVKALKSPRDVKFPPSVTQYAYTKASPQEIRDILLLTRPDYTLFDEIRGVQDFKLFADLRLSGVGMVGVVHANKAIDAVQRFIGKIELGMIPSIVDTVVFIHDGDVEKVYQLKMTVKVPTGMTESDLARPVVEISDFETKKLEYEIYSYGEATIVIPVEEVFLSKREEQYGTRELRWKLRETSKYFDFLFFTPTNKADVIINGVLVASLPLKKGRSIKVFKKSQLGKEILNALRSSGEIRFE